MRSRKLQGPRSIDELPHRRPYDYRSLPVAQTRVTVSEVLVETLGGGENPAAGARNRTVIAVNPTHRSSLESFFKVGTLTPNVSTVEPDPADSLGGL